MKEKLPIWRADEPLFCKIGDKHYEKNLNQIKNRGFSDSELWGLDSTIAAFILPRLTHFKKVNNGFPLNLTPESWDQILDKMINAFEIVTSKEGWNRDNKEVKEGLTLFAEYFRDLWW